MLNSTLSLLFGLAILACFVLVMIGLCVVGVAADKALTWRRQRHAFATWKKGADNYPHPRDPHHDHDHQRPHDHGEVARRY